MPSAMYALVSAYVANVKSPQTNLEKNKTTKII